MKSNDSNLSTDLTVEDPDLTEVIVPVSGASRSKNLWIRIAAYNSVGLGPYSEPSHLELEPSHYGENELVQENSARYTLPIALFGSFVFGLILVLSVLVYYRKRTLYARKSASSSQVIICLIIGVYCGGNCSSNMGQSWPLNFFSFVLSNSNFKHIANFINVNLPFK